MKYGFPLYFVLAAAACLFVPACGARNDTADTVAPPENVEGEPEFDIAGFEVLEEATTLADLPYLVGHNGAVVKTPCWAITKNTKSWQTENPSVLRDLEKNIGAIQGAVMAWARNALLPSDTSWSTVASWRVALEKPQIVHASLEHVRLLDDQQCIDEQKAALPQKSKTVTTLFGALELHFRSKTPLDAKLLKNMRKAAKKASARLKSVRYEYPRAVDAGGKPLKDEKGRPLFQGPGGELLPRFKIPKPKNRPVFEWKLVFKKPLYVAFGDLPSDVWAREIDPSQCSVNLIFDDATPRVPECAGAKDAGFGVATGGSPGTVVVKVTADGMTVSEEVPFNTRKMIWVAGRVIAWVTPKKLVEGALLNIDSLVLAPGGSPDSAPDSFSKSKKRSPGKKSKQPMNNPPAPPISY
ncbi:MAG: hypothetical protein GY854_09125 [Deltaproteobacteria bacterium]|nr:hypothetical protein [Deltaproteobacteria bacterium]